MPSSTGLQFCVLIWLLTCFAGCGGGRQLPERVEVTGAVKFGGKPLKNGTISFQSPEDIAIGLALNADVVDGQYKIKITKGEKTVQVSCFVPDPVLEFREIIPERYNKHSTLKVNVSETDTTFDFDLGL